MSNWTKKSKNIWDDAWTSDNFGQSSASLLSGLTGIVGAGVGNAQINDTTKDIDAIRRYGSASFNTDNFNSLQEDYDYNVVPDVSGIDDIKLSSGQKIGNTLSGISQGAMAGAQIGGPWGAVAGAALGLGSGLIGWAVGDRKAKMESERIDAELQRAKMLNLNKFNYSADLINNKMFNAASLNYRAFGGDLYDRAMSEKHYNNGKVKNRKLSYIGNLFAYGGQMKLAGDWSNGVTIIGEGGSHEMNPYEGVQVGVDQNGTPNLVEEGEVIFNDYVFSNRLKPSAKQLDEVKLCPSFEGESFSDIAKKISEESQERPNDPISKNGLLDGMFKLQAIQEGVRQKKAMAQLKRGFNKMSPEEQAEVAMSMIGPEDGQFSEEDVQPYNFNDKYAANGNPQDDINAQYEEEYGNGGNLFDKGSWLPILTNEFQYYTGTPGKGGKYDQGYLDWLNTYDIENSKYWGALSDLYKKTFNQDLTVDRARELGRDEQFGHFHKALGEAYSDFNSSRRDLGPKLSKIEISENSNSPLGRTIYKYNNSLLPKPKLENNLAPITKSKPYEEDPSGSNHSWLRFAPAIGSGIQMFADIFGANRPDYTNARMIGNAGNRIRNIRAPQLYNYMQYLPFDVNYEQNRLQNVGLGTQRNALNTTSGNRGSALAALLQTNSSIMSEMGDLYRKAREYNDNQRKIVSEFNRGTDQTNLQSILTASQANQNADKARADLIVKESMLRDNIDTVSSQARSANISSFFNNLGKIGQDFYYGDQADWLLRSGWLPDNKQTRQYRPRKNGGKIRKQKRLI